MRDVHKDIVGTWRLVRASATTADGKIERAPFGTGPTGFLIYTVDGTMAALISYGGRSLLSDDRVAAPGEERAQAFATFFAYAGRYALGDNQVIHHVQLASVQNWVGTELVRVLELEGDQLALRTPPMVVGGSSLITDLLWERDHGDQPELS